MFISLYILTIVAPKDNRLNCWYNLLPIRVVTVIVRIVIVITEYQRWTRRNAENATWFRPGLVSSKWQSTLQLTGETWTFSLLWSVLLSRVLLATALPFFDTCVHFWLLAYNSYTAAPSFYYYSVLLGWTLAARPLLDTLLHFQLLIEFSHPFYLSLWEERDSSIGCNVCLSGTITYMT